MARLARIVIPNVAYHVTQRGNHRAEIFQVPEDRRAYLNIFRHYQELYQIKVFAYCLMTNHVHFVVVPERSDSLTRTFHGTHTKYSRYFQGRLGVRGHLWQRRFFSCPLDEKHLWTAVRYVEQNPVRAGLVSRAEEYCWSSAGNHCGLRSDTILSDEFPPSGIVCDWRAWLQEGLEEETQRDLRCRTRTGRPLGSDEFLEYLERRLGRTLRPKKRGPRPKQTNSRQ